MTNKKLILAVDLGASLTKAFARLVIDGVVQDLVKTFSSAVQRTNKTRYLAGHFADDNTSLLEINSDYWMVGVAAKQEVSFTNTRQGKNCQAVAKILSMVGQILSEYEELSDGDVEIELGVLLPLDEVGGNLDLGDEITNHLYNFGHNGKPVTVGLVKKVIISPEGYGYALLAERRSVGILMFGHRDVAYLHIDQGSISMSDCLALPGRGMVKLLRETNYSFKDELRAAAAVFAAGDGFRSSPLLKLVSEQELKKLQQALSESRELIWAQMLDELSSSNIRSQELIICGGGNSYYWQPELRKEFGKKISFAGNILAEMQEQFPELSKSPLLPRCADCYRFWQSLPGIIEESNLRQVALSGGKAHAN
jgi:hypothetical protein